MPFDTAPALEPSEGAVSASFGARLVMNVKPSIIAQGVFLDQLPLDSISFDMTKERGSGAIATKREFGGILSGTVEYTGLDTRSNTLRPGEPLRLKLRDGKLKQFRFEGDSIVLGISGVAKEVSSGSLSHPVLLKPHLLEYLHSRFGLLFTVFMTGVPVVVAIVERGLRR
jgi:hypothetical protein